MARRLAAGGALSLVAVALLALSLAGSAQADTMVSSLPAGATGTGKLVFSGLKPVESRHPAKMQSLEDEGDGEEEEGDAVPAVPVVPVQDNYEAATNADDLITQALEHGTLSAAQAKAILAAAKAAASADAAKVAAAKKIVEAAKEAQGEAAEDAQDANEAAAASASKVAEDEKVLRSDEEAAGPPAAIAQQKQAALNSANQRLAAAMAYAATQTRNMDRALAAETAAKAAEDARAAMARAKSEADSAEIAARNLADVSSDGSSAAGGGNDQGSQGGGSAAGDTSVGEKIGIVIFFLLLSGALLFWWFQFGRGSGGQGVPTDSMPQSNYGTSSYGMQDTTV